MYLLCYMFVDISELTRNINNLFPVLQMFNETIMCHTMKANNIWLQQGTVYCFENF